MPVNKSASYKIKKLTLVKDKSDEIVSQQTRNTKRRTVFAAHPVQQIFLSQTLSSALFRLGKSGSVILYVSPADNLKLSMMFRIKEV